MFKKKKKSIDFKLNIVRRNRVSSQFFFVSETVSFRSTIHKYYKVSFEQVCSLQLQCGLSDNQNSITSIIQIVYAEDILSPEEPTGSFFQGTKKLIKNAKPTMPTATAKEALMPSIYARRIPGS